MTTSHRRIQVGVGARARYDGETYTITELLPTITGTDVVLAASSARLARGGPLNRSAD